MEVKISESLTHAAYIYAFVTEIILGFFNMFTRSNIPIHLSPFKQLANATIRSNNQWLAIFATF